MLFFIFLNDMLHAAWKRFGILNLCVLYTLLIVQIFGSPIF